MNIYVRGLLVAAAALTATSAIARDDLKLERVTMMMRHGVRPPTSDTPVPAPYSRDAWPTWDVDYGLLTEHGAKGARLLGAADRAYFVRHGLLPRTGCPADGVIAITASGKQRAQRTAHEWSYTVAPGCKLTVVAPADGSDDVIFHPMDQNPASFDGKRAYAEALALAPGGNIDNELKAQDSAFQLLNKALGCREAACDIRKMPTVFKEKEHDRPDLKGPIDVGSTASQTFLLEYLDGKPMKDVAWGRITRAEIEQMLVFHPVKFRYSNRSAYMASVTASLLMKNMRDAMNATGPKNRVTLFAGHDTNIADIAGFLDLRWKVPSYPADDVPPGSAVGFELWKNAKGARFVRAFYRAQTMDQLRNLTPIDGKVGPYRAYIDIPGCGTAKVATSCTLARFNALVDKRLKIGAAS